MLPAYVQHREALGVRDVSIKDEQDMTIGGWGFGFYEVMEPFQKEPCEKQRSFLGVRRS